MSVAFYPGRFQPFHNGHLNTVKLILQKHDKIIIGIRNTPINNKNPFTVEDRIKIITNNLQVAGILHTQYQLLMIPDLNTNWLNDLKEILKRCDVLYAGNPIIKSRLKNSGTQIKHLQLKIKDDNKYSAIEIRNLLKKNLSLNGLVLPEIEPLLISIRNNNE